MSGGEAVGAVFDPSPWHELVDARGGPQVYEPRQHVGQIGLRIDAVELAGLDQRRDARPILRAFVMAGG